MRTPLRHRQRLARLAAIPFMVGLLVPAGAAFAECDPGICVGGASCTVNGLHLLDDGCKLDFGGATVTVAPDATLRAAIPGGSFGIQAGSLVVEGSLEAPGSARGDFPTIDIDVTGDVITESVGGSVGVIDVKAVGVTEPGSLEIVAGGAVGFHGREVSADGGSARTAGIIQVTGASISVTGQLHADAGSGGDGGLIILTTTAGDIHLDGRTSSESSGTGTFGGEIDLLAQGGVVVTAPVQLDGGHGGDGGFFVIDGSGNVTLDGTIDANAVGTDAFGGDIDISGDAVNINGAWNVNGGNQGSGGSIFVGALGAITTTSASSMVATSGAGGSGGDVALFAEGDATVAGDVSVTTSGMDSSAGNIDVAAGGNRTLTIAGILDARSTAAHNAFDGRIAIGPACTLRLTGTLRTRNVPLVKGENVLWYRGSLDVTGGTMLADDDGGGNIVRCRCADLSVDGTCGTPLRCETAPVLAGGTIEPAADVVPTRLGPCTGCPNGLLDAPGEECDDNNFDNDDGCDVNCTRTRCGNGIVAGNEECEDGNFVDGDGCDTNCTVTRCGNAIATDGEECDDGDLDDRNGCDVNCKLCGNGVAAGNEECDDGNGENGDGCDTNCTATRCTNGIVTDGEECDDGNGADGDGCDTNCTTTRCGNGIVTSGEECDDGNAGSGDGCDANCTSTRCGNGIVTNGEECDDGDLDEADCCLSTCDVNLAGSCTDANPCTDDACGAGGVCVSTNNQAPCDDGDTCTSSDTCTAGTCVGTRECSSCCSIHGGAGCDHESCQACVCDTDAYCCVFFWDEICIAEASDPNLCASSCPVPCGSAATPTATPTSAPTLTAPPPTDTPTETPTPQATPTQSIGPTVAPTPVCASQPDAGCRTPFVAGKALVVLKDKADDAKDQLTWKWLKGAATLHAEFGDPTDATAYELCLYDASGLVVNASAPAGGTCNAAKPKPCWSEKQSGFKYKNKDLIPDGILEIGLKEGIDGKAKILVKGKGPRLAMPSLAALVSPVTVQLKTNDRCWSATYSFPPALANDSAQFKDKAD